MKSVNALKLFAKVIKAFYFQAQADKPTACSQRERSQYTACNRWERSLNTACSQWEHSHPCPRPPTTRPLPTPTPTPPTPLEPALDKISPHPRASTRSSLQARLLRTPTCLYGCTYGAMARRWDKYHPPLTILMRENCLGLLVSCSNIRKNSL